MDEHCICLGGRHIGRRLDAAAPHPQRWLPASSAAA